MSSIPERICQRIEALLLNATTAGDRVWRDREDAMTREESPAILIELADEVTETMGGNGPFAAQARERNALQVLVTMCVRGQGWQQLADTVRCEAHALLVADPDLRRLAPGIRRARCEWRPSNTDIPFGYASQMYVFTTAGSASDLTAVVA